MKRAIPFFIIILLALGEVITVAVYNKAYTEQKDMCNYLRSRLDGNEKITASLRDSIKMLNASPKEILDRELDKLSTEELYALYKSVYPPQSNKSNKETEALLKAAADFVAKEQSINNKGQNSTFKLKLGWSKEQCEAAIGKKPDNTTKSVSRNLILESWYYFRSDGSWLVLNFENEKLESIYDSRN